MGRAERSLLNDALDALDMVAVAVVADDEGDCIIIASGNVEGQVRQLRTYAKHGLGVEAVLWAPSAEVARRIADGARGRLVAAGKGMRGRWIGCRADIAEQAVRAEASDIGCRLLTDAERLSLAVKKVERRVG
jgi:hypothetical protein